jgi:hypothetical protein
MSGDLNVTNVPNNFATPINGASVGTTTDLGATQASTTRQFQLSGSPGDGNAVDIQDSNDGTNFNFVTTLQGGTRITLPEVARYIRTVRQSGTTSVVAQVGDAVGGSTPGALAYVNGGNSFGAAATIGPLDTNSFTVGGLGTSTTTTVTSGATFALTLDSGTTGDVNLGTGPAGVDASAKTIRVGTGAAVKTILVGSATGASSAQILVGSGGLGLGVAAPGGGNVSLDTPAAGTVGLASTNATTVAIGGSATLSSITIRTATGGTIGIGDQALATTITIGNSQGATAVAVNSGTGAASFASNATDHATSVGSSTGGSQLNLAAGTNGVGISAQGAGPIVILGGTGTSSFDVGTGGTLNLGTSANAKTINIGIGAAVINTTIGNVTGATTIAINAGTGGVTAKATGAGNVTLTPGATGNVQLNAAAAATCGVQLGIPVAVADAGGGGTIGVATVTVDIASVIEVNQTTGGQARTVPNPTITTQARILYLVNIGSASFTCQGKTAAANAANALSVIALVWSPGATKWFATA